MSDTDIVKIKCYGKWEKRTRKNAIEFYTTCSLCSEGSERERYSKILTELSAGYIICTDGE